MTDKDVESYKNLKKYLNDCWGFSKSSLLWLNERFDNPSKRELDPAIAKVVGDDFRARFDLSEFAGDDQRPDEGWNAFTSGFYTPVNLLNISNKDYVENLVTEGKQKVKIGKALTNFYLKNDREYFFQDIRRMFLNINGIRYIYDDNQKWPQDYHPYHVDLKGAKGKAISQEKYEELVAKHVLLLNEYCGRFKKSGKKTEYELVITANWVDWLLASTGERWSSCWNIEGENGFWTGIPFLFDDRNRIMFYITSKKNGKKDYRGLVADHYTTRSWGLLNKDSKLFPVRWFPGNYQIPSNLKAVTKLDIGEPDRDKFNRSKYPFMEHIRFHGDKGWLIPYLDRWGYGDAQGKNGDPPFYYKDGGHTGTSSHEEARNMWYPRSSEGKKHLFDLGVNLYERVYMAACTHCGTKGYKNDPSQMLRVRRSDGYVCIGCFTEKYDKCESCGEVYLKSELKEVTKHYKKICPNCVEEKFQRCTVCGELHLKDRIKNGICTECAITNPSVVFCKTCGEYHVIEKFKGVKIHLDERTTHYFCNEQCVEPFISYMKEMLMWKNIRKASCCKDYYHEDMLTVMPGKPHSIEYENVQQAGNKGTMKILRVDTGESFICPEHLPKPDEKDQLMIKFVVPRKKSTASKAAGAVA